MKIVLKTVTISGSYHRHFDHILAVRKKLLALGLGVLHPPTTVPVNPKKEFVYLKGEESLPPSQIENNRLALINRSDGLVVCDPEGYIGASVLLEIGYAHALKKPVIFTEKPKEFILKVLPFKVGLKNLARINAKD